MKKVNRFEVIDDMDGRVAVYLGVSVKLSYQDDGRTLKVFVRSISSPDEVSARLSYRPRKTNPITGTWTKRDDKSGKFVQVKADAKPFKGVRRER
jgi:hypothetical protein